MSPANSRQFKNKAGFTLIELLIVIAVIGILSGMVMVSFDGAKDKARIAKSLQFSNSVQNAIGVDMVGRWNFEKIEGEKVIDTSGYGNDGVVHGATLVPGLEQLGNALSFDGSSNYVEVSGLALAKISGDKLTVEAWVKPSSLSGMQYIVSKNGPFFLYMNGNKLGGSIYNGSWTELTGNISLSKNWQYLIMTYDGSNIKLYVNGVFDASTPKTGNLAGDGCTQIGDYNNGGCASRSYYFNGSIDEVLIYNAALSSSAIRENYLAGLDKLLASGQITEDDYQQRIAELNSNYVARK